MLNSIAVKEFHYFSYESLDMSLPLCYIEFIEEIESRCKTNMTVIQYMYAMFSALA